MFVHPFKSVTKLSCKFNDVLLNMIVNSRVIVHQQAINVALPPSLPIRLPKILSAGAKEVLEQDSNSFVDVTLQDVVQIASGHSSMIALTKQGEVYGRGLNRTGELALGDTNSQTEWTRVTGMPSAMEQVALRCSHSLFLSVEGKVFSCGSNTKGQLVSTT